MILLSFGLPGRFGDWCERAVELTARAATAVTIAEPRNLEDFAVELIKAEGTSLLVRERQPQAWLIRIVTTTGLPFVVSIDDPLGIASDLISIHALTPADATRRVGCGCASIVRCIRLPGALVLDSRRDGGSAEAIVDAIARHFGADPDLIDKTRIAQELGPYNPDHVDDQFGPEHSRVVDEAIQPYVPYFAGGVFNRLVWLRELFIADGGHPATDVVDVTGRVRALVYGPHINVPAGNWTAEIVLGFSEEVKDFNFLVDVLCAGSPLASTNIRPKSAGIFSVNLSFVVAEGDAHPLEFRVVNERAMFEGKMALSHVSLTWHPDASSSSMDTIKAELGLPS